MTALLTQLPALLGVVVGVAMTYALTAAGEPCWAAQASASGGHGAA